MAGRRLAAFVVVVLAVVAGLLAPATAQSTLPAGDAARFLDGLNRARTAHGLSELESDPGLVAVARRWAEHMAARGRLSHSRLDRRVATPWSVLGENVGRGPAPGPIHRGLMASAGHRRNMLDARFDRVGIATARRGAELYVAQVFLATPDRATPDRATPERATPRREAPPIRTAGGSR